MSGAVWEIYRYHFPNESDSDEFYNDWWQVLRNGEPVISGVDLLRADSYVRGNVEPQDTVKFNQGEWTGYSWRNRAASAG